MLRLQSLAYLCPYLNSINGEEFTVEATDDTIKTVQSAKQELAGLVRNLNFKCISDESVAFAEVVSYN